MSLTSYIFCKNCTKSDRKRDAGLELPNTVEGLVHVSRLPGDYFYYNESACEMVGEATGRSYKLGMPVRVRVLDCDRFTRTIDFEVGGK